MREIARFIAKEIEPMRKRQGVFLCKGNMKYKKCWTFAGSCGIGLCCKDGGYMEHKLQHKQNNRKNQARLWFGCPDRGRALSYEGV